MVVRWISIVHCSVPVIFNHITALPTTCCGKPHYVCLCSLYFFGLLPVYENKIKLTMNKPYQFSYQLTVFQLQQRFQRALGRRLLDTKVSFFFLTRFSTMGKKKDLSKGYLNQNQRKLGVTTHFQRYYAGIFNKNVDVSVVSPIYVFTDLISSECNHTFAVLVILNIEINHKISRDMSSEGASKLNQLVYFVLRAIWVGHN